jgi:prepilin-type N-terminal cleavage/methylation domain-containing protein
LKEHTIPARNNTHKHQGFTLIEVIVVILIMAIIAAIAVPSGQGYIKRAEVKAAVYSAQRYEEALVSLAAMQYAAFGNPLLGGDDGSPIPKSWSDGYTVDEKQYVYLDSQEYGIGSEQLIRMAPANAAVTTSADRTSRGLTEFSLLAGERYPSYSWVTAPEAQAYAQNVPLSVFYLWDAATVQSSSGGHYRGYVTGAEFVLNLYGGWYFFEQDGRQYAVFHNFSITGADDSKGVSADFFLTSLEESPNTWNVYELQGNKFYFFGSVPA